MNNKKEIIIKATKLKKSFITGDTELIPPATFEPPVRTFRAIIPALESRIFR